LNDYLSVKGPYFNALLDQILEEQASIQERRIALCTTQYNAERISTKVLPAIQNDLILNPKDSCILFILEDYNPLSMAAEINNVQPTIFWVVDDNAFRLRYNMRTSGLDSLIEQMCGSDEENCLYLGENAGAICAGASLNVAHALNHDPKQAPEPQFRGLELMGPQRSISFGISKEALLVHPKTSSECMNQECLELDDDKIFVWSQPLDQDVTSFVFLPLQRGGIEQLTSPLPVLPLLVEREGVECTGEPSIDPSRMMQEIGDSEWINEVESEI
jgi:hypothetical protein